MRIFVLYQIKKQMEKITLATLSTATAQQVFDQVAVHLLTQGRKSLGKRAQECAYRGTDNTMCAAGCLMSNKEYSTSMEGCRWKKLVSLDTVSDRHSDLIHSLQVVHDAYPVEYWRLRLINLAKTLGLNTNAIDNV